VYGVRRVKVRNKAYATKITDVVETCTRQERFDQRRKIENNKKAKDFGKRSRLVLCM